MKVRNGRTEGASGCPEAADAAAFVAGELDEAAGRRLADHAAACPECEAAVEAVRRTVATLRAVPDEKPGRDLAPTILTLIAAERGGRVSRIFGPAPARIVRLAAAAALVAALGAGVWLAARTGYRVGPAVAARPVDRGADWLCRIQEADGSWSTARWGGDARYEVALTSLALMALLQDEALPPPRAGPARRAMEFLRARQDATGRFGPAFDNAPYNHGMATLALLRAWERFRDPELQAPVDRAVAYIVKRQRPAGGWGYESVADAAPNLSVSYWQCEALRVAEKLGWPSVRAPCDRGRMWIAGLGDDEGFYGYRGAGDTPAGARALSAMGAATILTHDGGSEVPAARLDAVKRRVVEVAGGSRTSEDYYHSYFLMRALRSLAQGEGGGFLEAMRRDLLNRQVLRGDTAGSFEPDARWGAVGGRVYSTALAMLALK